MREDKEFLRILSIDGGGIRGLLPAQWLRRLEEALGRPVHDCFDLVAGTSTGGMIATMLCAPPPHLNDIAVGAMYSAKEIEKVYCRLGKTIFPPIPAALRCFGWCCFPKHAAIPLERELQKQLGDLRLEQTIIPLVIPAYNIDEGIPVVFNSLRTETREARLRDVCRATFAAPTFFPPATVNKHQYLDGGIFVNNPTMLAITHALEFREHFEQRGRDHIKDLRNLVVVSLGTGSKTIPEEQAERGKSCYCSLRAIGQVVKASMRGSAAIVHDEVKRLFDSFGAEANYIRLDIPLVSASKAMDDNSDQQLKRLANDAKVHLDKFFDKEALERQMGRMEPLKADVAESLKVESLGIDRHVRPKLVSDSLPGPSIIESS